MVKILTHNINGIRAILKKDNIIDNISKKNNTYLNYIKKENPDIICWNELKICKDKYSKEIGDKFLEEYPYKCINLSCEKKGYAGISLFSKIKPISSCIKLDDVSTGRYGMMEFDKFIIVCVYVINSGEKLKNIKAREEWNNIFLKKIKELQKKYKKEIIITGDFNAINRKIDTYNYKQQHNKISGVTDIEMNDFQKLLKETKLVDSWLELYKNKIQYSYFTYKFKSREHNRGMRIDYFLLSKKILKKIKNIDIQDNIYGSDHLVLMLELNI